MIKNEILADQTSITYEKLRNLFGEDSTDCIVYHVLSELASAEGYNEHADKLQQISKYNLGQSYSLFNLIIDHPSLGDCLKRSVLNRISAKSSSIDRIFESNCDRENSIEFLYSPKMYPDVIDEYRQNEDAIEFTILTFKKHSELNLEEIKKYQLLFKEFK